MKRLILLLLVFTSLLGNGQSVVRRLSPATTSRDSVSDCPHMKFMGIPLDGTLASFSTQLKKKGFKQIKLFDSKQMNFFVGNFAGYADCLVYVMAVSPEDRRVVGVGVTFPPDEEWSGLSLQYETLKRRLTSKYGEPSVCIERFQTSPQPDNDFMRMHYVESGLCEYRCGFKMDEGIIGLEIAHKEGGISDFNYVSLTYIDGANVEVMEQDAINDL